MREIKFRGKNEQGWHYGLLTFMFGSYAISHIEDENTVDLIDEKTIGQYSGMHDEKNLDDIWEDDVLEIESPKGKFLARVINELGTFGIVVIGKDDCITNYFEDHWNDHFMPLIDLYWNENGDDGCLPKSERLSSIHENPKLLEAKK